MTKPLLRVSGLARRYGERFACRDVEFDLYPGEMLAIVGESGAGKTTLLKCLSGQETADEGQALYTRADGHTVDIVALDETDRRRLQRTEWGLIHQNPRDGLRFGVSAGANVGERLMALGARHYGRLRSEAEAWLDRLEVDPGRIDDLPSTFSGGMQQRVQLSLIHI